MSVLLALLWAVCLLLFLWALGDPFKGATAWEWQLGRLCLRLTHLRGACWRWRPWRRVELWWVDKPRGGA